jgi:hypothetical protein
MMARIIINTRAIPTLIHSGDNTHNHDQVITPVNFNTMNATRRRPVVPTPPPDDVDLAIVILLLFAFSRFGFYRHRCLFRKINRFKFNRRT